MNMMKLLGFLGFLGLLGLNGNAGFYGFFGFFSFFVATKTDERLETNLYKAGFNAFVVSLITLSVLITALSLDTSFLAILIAVGFILMILTFVGSMLYYEKQ